MSNLITIEEIKAGIKEIYRPFFLIGSASFNPQVKPVIESLWEAIDIFAPKIKLGKPVHVLLATSPFKVDKENFAMSFESKGDVINFVVESFIFLDAIKMFGYPKELQIASIIEEFVHAFMNVSDEELVKFIVRDIYPKISVVDGCYSLLKP